MRRHSLAVYETQTHFYVIGSDVTCTSFSTLKIDRNASKELIIGEPNHDYSKADIGELLATVSESSSKFIDKSRQIFECFVIGAKFVF